MNRAFTSSKILALALALLVAVVLMPSAIGQLISGSLVGTIYDSSGAVVAHADVDALNVATGVKSTTKATASGEYRFNNLPVGTYSVTAKAAGFGATTKQVVLELNETGTMNFSLSPGAQSVTVEVSGAPPIIDTTTAQLQNNYEEKQLQDLPTAGVGLGVINLSLLNPGVGSTGGLGAGTGPSISGQRPRDNNFTIEGVDNNDKGVTGPLAYVPNDAVGNFAVLSNQFSPEFGHSNGGQFNTVVQSGTNSFHGRAYEYLQNRNFNAIDQSVANQTPAGQTPKNPRFDNNRFGGQVGGPIFKNKLFFFANYEYNPIGQAAIPGSPLLAPTAGGYTTLLGIPNVSTANIQALQKFAVAPAPCSQADIQSGTCPANGAVSVGGTPVQVGILPVVAPNFNNTKALTTSMDWNISDHDQIRGRYIYNKNVALDTGLTGVTLPQFFTVIPQPFHVVALSEYHQFSPMVTNEFRVGFNRRSQTFGVPNLTFLPTLDAFPNLTFDELGGLNIGPDPNAPQFAIQNLYQAVDNLSWTKGNHTLKFGVEGRKYITPQKFIQRSRGDYEYASFQSFAFDQIPDGSVNERSFGNVGYSGDQYGIFWYVNDNWKIKPNFSINLGLRYEYTSTPFGWTQQSLNNIASVPGLITFGSPQAPTKDFMPRVGFAYSPGTSGNTSIRGGFGLGYDVLYDNIGVLSRPPQIGSTIDCPTQCATSGFLANGGIPPQPGVTGITNLNQADARALTSSFLPDNVKYPRAITWNLGVQHVFAKDYTAEVRYVGTHGVNLNVQNRINVIDVVNQSNALPTFVNAPSQAVLDSFAAKNLGNLDTIFNNGGFFDPAYLNNGFFSEIVGFMPWGNSIYHGLQTQLTRRLSNGLQFQAAYTFSHNIDNSTADFFSTIVAPRRPQDFRDLPAERGNSVLDHRHRFTLSAIYDVPWFKHGNWFMKNVVGNYEIAPVYTWESGQWGTIQAGHDANMNTDGAGDRAVLNPAGLAGTGSGVHPLCTSSIPSFATCGENDFDPTVGPPGPGNFDSHPFIVAYAADNPNARFLATGTGSLPNTGRGNLQVAPINNWDISLSKHFNITERVRIDFLFQMLNAFNHPQFITGSVNQVNSISVTGQGQRNFFIPSANNFNDLRASWPSNARTSQFGLKFIF
jgi:hypothetical protein